MPNFPVWIKEKDEKLELVSKMNQASMFSRKDATEKRDTLATTQPRYYWEIVTAARQFYHIRGLLK